MSDLMLDVDQASELKAAFRRGDWTNAEIKRLSEGDFLTRVRGVILGRAEITVGKIDCDSQPEIPDWADKEKPIIQHLPCGMTDPTRFATANVFEDKEGELEGEEYILRAQKLDSLNACAFDFYAKPENWKYLPKDVDVIVFPKTIFRFSGDNRFVRYLYCRGAKWSRDYRWLVNRFNRFCRVAVLASPRVLETKNF